MTPSRISETTRAKALKALDGMATIVKAERLERGVYVSDEVVDPRRAGALCQGRNYCAIGSLWVGAGIRPTIGRWVDLDERPRVTVSLPGAALTEKGRAEFMRRRPGLRVAYQALNAAADDYIERRNIDRQELLEAVGDDFEASIELLFEGDEDLGRTELLKIINSAKRKVRAS